MRSFRRSAACAALGVLSLILSGCAALIVRDDDSWYTQTAKVAVRIVLGVCTLDASEYAGMEHAKYEDSLATFTQEMNDNVGHWTLDDAASAWGAPNTRYTGDQVDVFGWTYQNPYGHWGVTLAFDKQTGLLKSWQRNEW